MTKEGYKNKLKLYLARKKIKASAADLKKVADKHFGKTPASVAVLELYPKPEARSKARETAFKEFGRVLAETCLVFEKDVKDVKKGQGDDFRDLKSAAAFIALVKLKIRPAIAISETLGLPSPASAYTASYRGQRQYDEKVLFAKAVDRIIKNLKEVS